MPLISDRLDRDRCWRPGRHAFVASRQRRAGRSNHRLRAFRSKHRRSNVLYEVYCALGATRPVFEECASAAGGRCESESVESRLISTHCPPAMCSTRLDSMPPLILFAESKPFIGALDRSDAVRCDAPCTQCTVLYSRWAIRALALSTSRSLGGLSKATQSSLSLSLSLRPSILSEASDAARSPRGVALSVDYVS